MKGRPGLSHEINHKDRSAVYFVAFVLSHRCVSLRSMLSNLPKTHKTKKWRKNVNLDRLADLQAKKAQCLRERMREASCIKEAKATHLGLAAGADVSYNSATADAHEEGRTPPVSPRTPRIVHPGRNGGENEGNTSLGGHGSSSVSSTPHSRGQLKGIGDGSAHPGGAIPNVSPPKGHRHGAAEGVSGDGGPRAPGSAPSRSQTTEADDGGSKTRYRTRSCLQPALTGDDDPWETAGGKPDGGDEVLEDFLARYAEEARPLVREETDQRFGGFANGAVGSGRPSRVLW